MSLCSCHYLGGSPGPFGSAVVPLVGVSSEDQPGFERSHSGQIGGQRLLEDTQDTSHVTSRAATKCGSVFPKRTSSKVYFCPQPRDIEFSVTEEQRSQKIFLFLTK